MFFENLPFGSMQSLHEFFKVLREINIYLAGVLFIASLVRIAKIHLYWRALSKKNKLGERLNLEKMLAWTAISVISLATTLSSISHKVYNSGTGIFIPLTTAGLLIAGLAVIMARKEPGINQTKDKNERTARRFRKPFGRK